MMRKTGVACVAIVLLLVSGCEETTYEIEMRARNEDLIRKLTCRRETVKQGGERVPAVFPEEELARIAKAFGKPVPKAEAREYTFEGEFTKNTPNDVGGTGTFTHFTSRMGNLSAYVERFRGRDDQAAAVLDAFQATDELVDVLIGWFEAELGGEPGFDKLRAFLDERLRLDVKNLGLHFWMAGWASRQDEDAMAAMALRMGLYLADRDYFDSSEVPTLLRTLKGAGDKEREQMIKRLHRAIADRMGVPSADPIPRSLAFLSTPEAASESFERHYRTTERYRKQLAAWEEARARDPDAPRPEPGVSDLVGKIVVLNFLGRNPKLRVSFSLPVAPFRTNGEWDKRRNAVIWSAAPAGETDVPVLMYALWSEPDAEFQKRHFGRAILAGRELADYVMWRNALAEHEAVEWDRFLSGLEPGDGIEAAVRSFRFSWEPKAEDGQPPSHADEAKGAILDALERKAEDRADE